MNVSIFGLGYVGCVSVACLANSGHNVIGCDIKQEKVDKINDSIPTIVEKGVSYLLNTNRERISATTNVGEAVLKSSVSIICVGTPTSESGALNTEFLFRAAESIAQVLQKKNEFHIISIRSTVPAGTNAKITKMVEKVSGKLAGKDFDVVSNPEFLREGNAIDDYFNPSVTVIGVNDPKSPACQTMLHLYSDIKGEKRIVNVKTAEIIKYVNNSWHALKIAFTNEVGRVSKEMDINSTEVMDLFCQDDKLNLSAYYMKPGYAYGGPCLPKDLKGLNALAKEQNLILKVLNSVEESNQDHVDFCLQKLTQLDLKNKKIAFLGISFKAGTDDLRNSTKFDLCKKVFEINPQLKIHDPNVLSSLQSKINHTYIEQSLGNMSDCLTDDLEQVLKSSDLIIYSHKEPYYEGLGDKLNSSQVLFELSKLKETTKAHRVGICW